MDQGQLQSDWSDCVGLTQNVKPPPSFPSLLPLPPVLPALLPLPPSFPLHHSQDGSKEVAVKTVNKDFFKQDPKVRENLDREIRIMKILRGCEYVVHLFHVQVS